MKVLFNTYPMAFHTPGGGEMQLLAYRDHLPAHGVEISMFNLWDPRFEDHDVVHFFSCIGGSSHFCSFVKQLGLPLVVSSSLWITEDTRDLYPHDEIRRQLSLADRIVTNSDMECDQLSRVLELPREKFVTVYNGVDPVYFEPISERVFRERFDLQDRFVLNVGNIEPRKNQLQLVRAMRAFPNLKLVVVGHTRDSAYAWQCNDESGGQMIYVGPLARNSDLLRSAFAACELFVLPSTLETPGLAALEAAAIGARLVVTEVGSTREYFGEKAQYLNPDSVSSITEAIRRRLSHREDELELSEKILHQFVWPKVTQQLAELYQEISLAQGST